MALHWLFPTPVLQVDLEPDAATAAAMQQQLEQFDAQVYQHPEFSDRNNLTGDLLFPSDLRHRVLPYEGNGPRYSVSYDLAITTAPGKGREMRTPHPMDWVPLGS